MNTKKLFLSFLTVLFVGVINAGEGLNTNDATRDEEQKAAATELLKKDCLQLLILQEKARETNEGKALVVGLQQSIFLKQQFDLEYNKCEQINMCDDLAKAFFEYKKSILTLEELAKKQYDSESYQELAALISK